MKWILFALILAGSLQAQNLDFYLDPSNGGLPQSQLTPLPSTYSFADTTVGASTSTVIRVVNTGPVQVTMSIVFVGGASGSLVPSDSFTVTGYGLGSVIAPGNYKVFTLNFTPRIQGSVTGYLEGNVAGLPVSIATLTGSGAPPAITLSCNSSAATQCSGAVLQPSTTAAINFGNVLTTAAVAIPFTLTNNGTNALNPQALVAIATTTNNPSTPFLLSQLPATLAAGGATTFTVTFSPGTTQTFLTNLVVGTSSFAIQGTGTASVLGDISSLLITYTDSTGVRLTAQPATALSFGQVVAGTTTGANKLTFTVSNPQTTISAVSVSTITATGSGFSIAAAPSLPASIAPGSSITFQLVFVAPQTGTFSGTLSIGTRQFSITAQGVSSSVPDASFAVDISPLVSSKQVHLSVNLASATPVNAIGTVTMSFTPLVSGISDDPAINFMATSGRQLQVTFTSGAQTGTYNGDSALTFQTGTTAGTLTFTLSLPNKADYKQSFTIAPSAVQIISATAVRQSPNLVLTLTGFDNTYSAGKMSFNFLNSAGQTMTPSAVNIDASAKFHAYFFPASSVGGAFSLQASFPVNGDVTKVASVAVTISNTSGATTQSQTFQ